MNHWYFSAVVSTTRAHGLWSGIRLTFILLRSAIRAWLEPHQRLLGAAGMAAILAGSVWLLSTTTLISPIQSGAAAWLATVLLAASLAGMAIGTAHFLLRPASRPFLLYQAVKGVILSVMMGFAVFLGYERWIELYRADPTSATLMGIVTMAVLLGFHEAANAFIRSAMFRSVLDGAANGELREFLALSEQGRWRVAVHEAGHAVAYGLCTSIPEDAYACLEPDLMNTEAGAVGFPRPDATETTKDRMEWMMICSEAGPAAEELFFGDRSIAGVMDMNQLHGLATAYLVAGFGEVIEMEPVTEQTILANRSAIGRLRDTNRVLTTEFVSLNRSSIERLAKRLLEVEFMSCEDMRAALQDAVPLPGRPLMSWPTSIPSIPRLADAG